MWLSVANTLSWTKSVIGLGEPSQESIAKVAQVAQLLELIMGLQEANFNLRSHLHYHLLVLERTEEEVRNYLALIESPELGKEKCQQLRDLIAKDQFLDCTFDEARNHELRSAYEELVRKTSTYGTWTASAEFEATAERAVEFGIVGPFLVAGAYLSGFVLPESCKRYASPTACNEILNRRKEMFALVQETGRQNIFRIKEANLSLRVLHATANMFIEIIEKCSGNETEKIRKLWRWYEAADYERLGKLQTYQAKLLRLINKFKGLILDLAHESEMFSDDIL